MRPLSPPPNAKPAAPGALRLPLARLRWPRLAVWALSLGLALPAAAQQPDLPGAEALVEELRGMSQAVRNARERVAADLTADNEDVLTRLNQALVWHFAEDHPKAALRLMELLSRPGIAQSPAYPDVLAWLAQALWAMGMETAAVQYFREALAPPAQTPTDYRARVALWLDHDRNPPLDLLRIHLPRAAEADERAEISDNADEPQLDYRFARGLYRAGALAEARQRFEAVPPTNASYLQARYFLGVIHLREDDLVQARAAFEETLEAWEATVPEERIPPDLLKKLGNNGPNDRLLPLDEDAEPEPLALPDAGRQRHQRMGTVIHLALARLSAAEEHPIKAWSHYRQIPHGDPDHAAAMSEATFVLARREAFDWAVRVLDQLIADRGQDVSAAQLALWRNQLLARGARYTDAEKAYEALEAELRQVAEDVEARIAADHRLFPPTVLAWAAPEQSDRARRTEGDLVEQTESILEAREIIGELEALQRTTDFLPIVAFGREQVAVIQKRLDAFEARLVIADTFARTQAPEDDETYPNGPPADAAGVRALRESAGRLRQRLDLFNGGLSTYEKAWRARIASVLADEKPAIAQLDVALRAEEDQARAVSTALTAVARDNLDHYAAQARLGSVDLAWWRKDEITRRIRDAHQARAEIEKGLDEISRELPPLPPPAPRSRPEPAADDAETEAGAPGDGAGDGAGEEAGDGAGNDPAEAAADQAQDPRRSGAVPARPAARPAPAAPAAPTARPAAAAGSGADRSRRGPPIAQGAP